MRWPPRSSANEPTPTVFQEAETADPQDRVIHYLVVFDHEAQRAAEEVREFGDSVEAAIHRVATAVSPRARPDRIRQALHVASWSPVSTPACRR